MNPSKDPITPSSPTSLIPQSHSQVCSRTPVTVLRSPSPISCGYHRPSFPPSVLFKWLTLAAIHANPKAVSQRAIGRLTVNPHLYFSPRSKAPVASLAV